MSGVQRIPARSGAPMPTELVARLERGERSNALDVLVEIALFKPCATFSAIRANSAGTKVIYSYPDRQERTFWAADWSLRPREAIENLRLRATTPGKPSSASEGVGE